MEQYIISRLNDKSISDLKAMRDFCKEQYDCGSKIWYERYKIITEVIESKINYIFE